MYYARPVARRCPATVRIVQPTRNASFFPTPFIPRSPAAEFNSLFRALDDFASPRAFNLDHVFAPVYQHHARQSQHFFPATPKFDVQETTENYELRGEIPGVENENLSVEFTDGQTLTIRGQITHESSSGTPPAAAQAESADVPATEAQQTNAVAADAATEQQAVDNSDAASTYSTGSYQKPSVEDEDFTAEEPESSADAQARLTPATSEAAPQEQTQPQQEVSKQAEQQQPKPRYWISERSTGSFQRTFKFPGRIDQDAVKASLKNGILSIVVPKAAAPTARTITVE